MKMKGWLILFASLASGLVVWAQDPVKPPANIRMAPQLDELLGPIALYPDPLIAILLPAADDLDDIGQAVRYLDDNGDVAAIEDQPWDDSVRALAHYPDLLRWMNQNADWTRQVGESFRAQSADVMQSIQRLRAAARTAGTLVDTAQQRVVVEGDTIRILPVQSDVIYIPSYDPAVVYVPQPRYYSRTYLTFGVGYTVGSWLAYDCDWHERRIWVRPHRRDMQERRDWNRPPPPPPGPAPEPRRPWTPTDHSRFPRNDPSHGGGGRAMPRGAIPAPVDSSAQAVIPPTQAVVPETQGHAVIPPTQAVIPPTQAVIPPTQAVIPPTQAVVPPVAPAVNPVATTRNTSDTRGRREHAEHGGREYGNTDWRKNQTASANQPVAPTAALPPMAVPQTVIPPTATPPPAPSQDATPPASPSPAGNDEGRRGWDRTPRDSDRRSR